MTAAPSARPRPYLLVEAKRDAHSFEESRHPRDQHGRFTSIGATPSAEGSSRTRGTKFDTPVSKYGMTYSAAAAANPRVQALKNDKAAWGDVPTEAYSLRGSKLLATEQFLRSGEIDKVASGREAPREGYDAHILRTDGGDIVIDGHHRVAMYQALDRETMPAKVMDARTASEGRKVTPAGTLRTMGATGRQRPHLVVEEKLVHPFDPGKHPRDDHGRWAHTPGGGKRVKIPKGYHVGARVEVQQYDFKAPGQPLRWYPATVENVTAHESGRTLDVQVRMEEDGRPHVQTIGIRGGNPRIRPVSDTPSATPDGAVPMQRLPDKGRPDGTGTADDPIAVGDDLARAAQLIADGKHVRLDQTEQVATLVDKLRELVEHARARGEKAPVYDLCRVSVPGTNLFCKQSKGIPRIKMPQFRGNDVRPGSPAEAFRGPDGGQANIEQPFREALAAMGIPTRLTTVPASHLRASQSELDGGKVSGIAASIEAGRMPDVPIFVTRDNYIIDGHHRWAGKVAVDTRDGRLGDVMMPVEVVDLDIGAALDYANAFMKVMGLASQSVNDPGSGKAPTPSRKVISLTVPSLPPDFKQQMTKALAEEESVGTPAAEEAPVDESDAQGEEAPVDDGPRPSRIAEGLDAVYGATAVHHVGRAINAVYAEPGTKAAALDVPDLASIGSPEPGAEPVGAHAFFAGPDGVEAWLDTSGGEPVGYFRDAARPYRVVRVDDAHAWAAVVDHLGLHEDPVPTVRTPAPVLDAGSDEEPADEPPVEGEAPAEGGPPPAGDAPAEGKSARGQWEAAKHPRDKHGRFARIGDTVSLDSGGRGKVTGIDTGGKLTVRKADGSTVKVDPKKVAKVAGDGGGKNPTAPSGGAPTSAPRPAAPRPAAPRPGGNAATGGGGGAPGGTTSAPTPGGGRTAAATVDAVSAGNGRGGDSGRGGPHAGLADADLTQQMQSAAPGPEFDALHEEATRRAGTYASDLLGRIGAAEPDVTKTLTGMADQFGGRMEGLQYRIKTEESLSRKIRDKSLVSGRPMDAVTAKVGDALRYTMILDEEHYAEGAGAVMRDFESQGMTIIDQDNSWHPGNVYQGINSVIRTPDGILFELQFHTQSSFDAKMSTHHDYELARDPKATLAERLAAWDRMAQLQAKTPVPPNVGLVGVQRVYGPPTETPTPASKSLYDTMEPRRRGGSKMATGQSGTSGSQRFYALHLPGEDEPFAVASKSAKGAPRQWVPGHGWIDSPLISDYFTGEDTGAKEITAEEAHSYMESGLGALGEGAVEAIRGAE